MAKFKMTPLVPVGSTDTARIGSDTKANGGNLTDKDLWKFMKLVADSRYDLCAVGDPIEGQLTAVDPATQDGYAIGSVQKNGRMDATCDGLQATPGTGTIAVGDLVVCGTVVAAGTALASVGAVKVCKATDQTAGVHNWRVVSLGAAGAVGDTCVIERIG